MSNFLENALLDFLLRGRPLAAPSVVYLALGSAESPPQGNETGDFVFGRGVDEVVSASYARVPVPCSLFTWSGTDYPTSTKTSLGSSGLCYLLQDSAFPLIRELWAPHAITHLGIFDAPTGGNLLFYSAFAKPFMGDPGIQVRFPAGSLSLQISRPGDLPDGLQVACSAQAVSLAQGSIVALLRAAAAGQASVTASMNDRHLAARLTANAVASAVPIAMIRGAAAASATVPPARLRALLRGAAAATSSLVGTAAVGRLHAALNAVAQASGGLTIRRNVAAQAQAQAQASGALMGWLRATATAAASFTGTSSDGRLFGALRAVATLAGQPRVAKQASGSASASATAGGRLVMRLRSTSGASALLTARLVDRLRATSAASATTTARALARLRAAPTGQSTLIGGLVRLAGSHAFASATVTATLSVHGGGVLPTGTVLLDGGQLLLDSGRLLIV